MFLLSLSNNIFLFLAFILSIVIAISVHEFAHAYTANLLGDPTAKSSGRMSLNPLAHLDAWGLIFLLIVGIGWGKPVPVNSLNLKNPKIDSIIVSLAGPFSNLLIAFLLALLFRVISTDGFLASLLFLVIQTNLVLMIFNLIPFPPLDGAELLNLILPEKVVETINELSTPLLISFLIFATTTNYVSDFIHLITSFFLKILLGI